MRLTTQHLAIRDSVVDVRAVVRLSLQHGRPNAPRATMSASHRRAGINSSATRGPFEVNARTSGDAPGEVNLATGDRLPQVEVRPPRRATS
ncbi:hypothetical protein BH10PSE11_BH10PSE11_10940 [soil metagenome]